MQAEVIAIGDELTSGVRLDTNSRWLSLALADLGIATACHTTVGDDLPAIVQSFRIAADRSQVVIVTGGLGPTDDDLTRQALADAAGLPLQFREEVLEQIRALFRRRGREMPASNRVQAMFPQGSCVIENPHGSAPGVEVKLRQATFFALPGVPAEMKEMWRQSVLPAIETLQKEAGEVRQMIRHHQLRCFGAGESTIAERLPGMIQRGRVPAVGITASQATITLRITAAGNSEAACRQSMQPTLEAIRNSLGSLIYGEGEEELYHAVVRLLAARKKTLAVAEWGTRGLLAQWLSEADSDGDVFQGGIVVREKIPAFLSREQAESEPDYAAIARACRQHFQADFGLVVGPFPNNEEQEFTIALAEADQVHEKKVRYAGHPDILLQLSAKHALNYLRLLLEQ